MFEQDEKMCWLGKNSSLNLEGPRRLVIMNTRTPTLSTTSHLSLLRQRVLFTVFLSKDLTYI